MALKTNANCGAAEKNTVYISWAVFIIILLFTSAVRVRLLGVPLERDEGEYAYAGQLILQGVPPYQLAYNMKMPGIYVLYSGIMALFGQTCFGIHFGLLLANIATAFFLFMLGRKLYDPLTGAIAGACFALLSLDASVQGVFANAEHFVILFAVAGILLLLYAADLNRLIYYFLSGLLLGTAFLLKQHGIVFIILGVIYLYYFIVVPKKSSITSGPIPVNLSFAGGIITPFVLTVLALLLAGVFKKFYFWTFAYAQQYASFNPFISTYAIQKTLQATQTYPIVWLIAIFGIIPLTVNLKPKNIFITIYFILSFCAVCIGFYFRNHYYILALPSMALLFAVTLVSAGKLMNNLPVFRIGIPVFFSAAIFLPSIYSQRGYLFRKDMTQVSRYVYGINPFPESLKIAEYISKHTSKNDRIAVIGSEPQIYFYSKRRSATGYIYMYPLMENQRFASSMQWEMIKEIESAGPEIVVFVNVETSWLSNPHSDTTILKWFGQYQQKYYERVGVVAITSLDKPAEYYWDKDPVGFDPHSGVWVSVFQRKSSATAPVTLLQLKPKAS